MHYDNTVFALLDMYTSIDAYHLLIQPCKLNFIRCENDPVIVPNKIWIHGNEKEPILEAVQSIHNGGNGGGRGKRGEKEGGGRRVEREKGGKEGGRREGGRKEGGGRRAEREEGGKKEEGGR